MKKTSHDITKQTMHEIAIMRKMIMIYCHGNHRNEDGSKLEKDKLCPECNELLEYALGRIDKCPVKETKDFCSNCSIHCYQTEKREKIREVMRYSGPRMILHTPITAVHHVIRFAKHKSQS